MCSYFKIPENSEMIKLRGDIKNIEEELLFQRGKGTPESILSAGIEDLKEKKRKLEKLKKEGW